MTKREDPQTATSPTILIVDDKPANLAVVEESLQTHGFRVVVAQDGEEALQRAKFVRPDLILLDVMMPEPDGLEVCRRLKAQADTRDIPVIFMTALMETSDKVSGFQAGGVDYLTKPLEIDEVMARVNTHLKLRAMQHQLEKQNVELQGYRDGLEQQVMARTAELRESNQQLRQEIEDRVRIEAALRESEQKFRTLAENSPDVIVRYDREFRRVFVNPAYYRQTGVPLDTAQGRNPNEIWAPINIGPEEFKARLRQVMETGKATDILLEVVHPDGRFSCDSLLVVAEYDVEGNVIGTLGIGHDISELIYHEHLEEIRLRIFELMARGGELSEILGLVTAYVEKSCPEFLASIMLMDADGQHLISTQSLSLPAEYLAAINGLKIGDGVGSCGTAAAWRKEIVIVEDVRTHPYWVDYKHLLQPSGLISCWSAPILDSTGKVLGTFGIYRRQPGKPSPEDMDLVRRASHLASIAIERKRAERTLFLQQQELRSLVENTPDTITRFNQDCRCLYANPKMVTDLGMPLEKILNRTPSEMTEDESSRIYEDRLRKVLASGKSEDFELAWRTGDNKQTVSYIRLTPELGVNGEVASVLAVGRDITEIDEYRQSIHHLAFYDVLTELPNRALLMDRLNQTVADASWHGSQFGLLMLDLDRFKEINDTLGHGIGDLLLREVANRLLQCVRSYDTVARLGGDEFAVLLPAMREGEDLVMIARKIIVSFESPFNISGKEIFVSASIGIAVYPADSADIDVLFRYADSAMYYAKKQGRNNFQFYSKELTARSSERMTLETALRKARKKNEFELYYQPQVDISTCNIIGAEVLLRWNQGEQGMIMPDRFIPVAEETGMIVGIGEWVLAMACEAAVVWNKERDNVFKIAVNLSTRQFIQNNLVGSINRILTTTHCKPEWLKLEITESLLLDDSDDILKMLNTLHNIGLDFSIDDFGTGYSALSYLNRFPVSQIKIDRSFVRDIPDAEDKAELVKAMISIAQALHLELIAEGVETDQQASYLLANGCRIAQGYLYGKPMPRAAFEQLLAQNAITATTAITQLSQ